MLKVKMKMTSRTLINVSALLMGGLLLSGCTARWTRDVPLILDSRGPLAIDVESFNGDVNIYVDEDLKVTEVQVVREGDYGHRRTADAVHTLDAIQYSAEIVPGDLGPVLQVRTWTDAPESHYQRAHVTIRVAAVENVRVRTTRGRVYATDIQGEVDISTTGGDVRVMTNRPMTRSVTIENVEGDIDYRVRAESTAAILAQTVDGKVRPGARFGRFIINEQSARHLVATLNGGTNPVHLQTVEGDIRISVVSNPTAVGLFIVDP